MVGSLSRQLRAVVSGRAAAGLAGSWPWLVTGLRGLGWAALLRLQVGCRHLG